MTPTGDGMMDEMQQNYDDTMDSSLPQHDAAIAATAQELVHLAWFVDNHGRTYTGSKKATILALDGRTGKVLKYVLRSDDFPPYSTRTPDQKSTTVQGVVSAQTLEAAGRRTIIQWKADSHFGSTI